jgi:hypothetical protein
VRYGAALVLAAAAAACNTSASQRGAVTVHVTFALRSDWSNSSGSCHGIDGLTGYADGHTIAADDQASHPAPPGRLTHAEVQFGACRLRATFVLPAEASSLWLPKDEQGIAGCRSRDRGGVLFERREPDVNDVVALPAAWPTSAPRANAPC